MKFRAKLLALSALMFMATPLHLAAQTWADSLSAQDRFWSRSGGYARQIALAGGGFGMATDTGGMKTLAVNPYSVDPLNMITNPAYASHYRSDVWFDAGLASNNNQLDDGLGQQFGGTFSVSDNFTAGLILARSDAAGFSLLNPNIYKQLTPLASTLKVTTPANTWEVFGALKAGSADIGLAVAYQSSSSNTTGTGASDSTSRLANYHQLGISAGLLLSGDDGMLFDLGGTLLLPSVASGNSTTGTISLTAMGVNSRIFIPLHKEFFLVPMVNLYLSKGTSTYVSTPKDLPSSTNIDGGLGLNFWQSGVHIMGGVSIGAYSTTTPAITGSTQSLTRSQFIFPRFNIGAEWPALKWLTLRMGYIASSGTETKESPIDKTSTMKTTLSRSDLYSPTFGAGNASPSGLTLGAGFAVGRFTADVTVNELFLHNPLGIFSGSPTIMPIAFVSLGYRFD